MKQLVEYLVRGLVREPDAVRVNAVDGESSLLLELSVADGDLDRVRGADGATLHALRTVVSASAGRRKAVLELLEPGANGQGSWDSDESPTDEVERDGAGGDEA